MDRKKNRSEAKIPDEKRDNNKRSIVFVVGTRPNFIKAAPILKLFDRLSFFNSVLIHTGQHFDYEMSRLFFKELGIRKPDYNLQINGSSHAELTALMITGLEKKFILLKPEMVVVVGDVDSTLAAALAAVKLHIPIAHVEAGLRSNDMLMPEETNRIITDRISDILFIHSPEARTNLLHEGISYNNIYYVGNIMIDMLKMMLGRIKGNSYLAKYKLTKNNYAFLTLHRPSNVDDKTVFKNLLETISEVSSKIPVIFPIHPRTQAQIEKYKFHKILKNLIITSPLGYLENLAILKDSKLVLTDSGGIQEETTYLHIPCLTLRENTERHITEEIGSNTVVGTDREKILFMVKNILNSDYKTRSVPKYWDGKTASRIVKILLRKLNA